MLATLVEFEQQSVEVSAVVRVVSLQQELQLPHRRNAVQHCLLLECICHAEVSEAVDLRLNEVPSFLCDFNLALVLDIVIVGGVVDYVHLLGIANLDLEGRRGVEPLDVSHNVGVDCDWH